MGAVNPRTSYPAFTVAAHGSTVLTNTSASVAVAMPTTQNGQRPMYVFVSAFQLGNSPTVAAAHIFFSPTATSATATTGDTIVTSQQGIWFNTLGMNAMGALGITGNVRVQVSPLEDAVVVPSTQASGLG